MELLQLKLAESKDDLPGKVSVLKDHLTECVQVNETGGGPVDGNRRIVIDLIAHSGGDAQIYRSPDDLEDLVLVRSFHGQLGQSLFQVDDVGGQGILLEDHLARLKMHFHTIAAQLFHLLVRKKTGCRRFDPAIGTLEFFHDPVKL